MIRRLFELPAIDLLWNLIRDSLFIFLVYNWDFFSVLLSFSLMRSESSSFSRWIMWYLSITNCFSLTGLPKETVLLSIPSCPSNAGGISELSKFSGCLRATESWRASLRKLLYPGLFLILLICFTLMSEKCLERAMLILFLSWSFSPTSALDFLFHSFLKHFELFSSIVSKQSEGWDSHPTNGFWIFSEELLMHWWRIFLYSMCLLCPRIAAKVR